MRIEPLFNEGIMYYHEETGNWYKIINAEFCRKRQTIRYKVQSVRYGFDMFMIDEPTLRDNVESELFTLQTEDT